MTTHYDTDTTIAAISTPPGIGGIAVIRVSGPDALTTVNKIWKGKPLDKATTHTAHLGTIYDTDNQPLDQAIATIYKAPNSFTGQDTVEISVHGSKYIQQQLLNALTKAGAQIALPGQFTQRAFANHRIELTQAEAIADIIASTNRAAHRQALDQLKGSFAQRINDLRNQLLHLSSLLELELDFSDQDLTFADRTQLRTQIQQIHTTLQRMADTYQNGQAIKNGIPVAITGPTNAGKSSLLNALLDDNRAIVSDIHGTTRDTIEETTIIGDYEYRFIDTAGLRHTTDPIEEMGQQRTHQAIDTARIILTLIDANNPTPGIENARQTTTHLHPHQIQITILNKIDTNPNTTLPDDLPNPIALSAKTRAGIETLTTILNRIAIPTNTDANDIIITNARQAQAMQTAADAAADALTAMDNELPTDLIAEHTRQILNTLSEITGQITTDEVLHNIFAHFCVGK